MKMKKTALKSAAGVSANVMARLSKNEYFSLESIEKICADFDCGVDDILDFIADDTANAEPKSLGWAVERCSLLSDDYA